MQLESFRKCNNKKCDNCIKTERDIERHGRLLCVDGEKWYVIQPMPTRTWVVIRSQRFLKLEGKSFHTSLFFVSLFVLTFARLCSAFIVSVCCRLYYIIVIIIALLLQHERWCDDAYLVRVTVLWSTCCQSSVVTRCASERNNAQQKNKREYGRSKMRWTSFGLRL